MKAVKSELAKRLLADPSARLQIRNSITGQVVGNVPGQPLPPSTVVLDRNGRQERYKRVVVPKAA